MNRRIVIKQSDYKQAGYKAGQTRHKNQVLPRMNNGDIIEMILNFNSLTVTFKVNNKATINHIPVSIGNRDSY